MCTQCAFDASKAAASAGGVAGLGGLAAAAAGMLGMKRLSAWLVTREVPRISQRAMKIATPAVAWIGLIAVYGVRVG